MTNQLIQDPNKLETMKTTTFAVTPIEESNSNINRNYLDFDSIKFPRGTKILTKLTSTHNQLLDIFKDTSNIDSLIDIDKIKKLELDIYNQGIAVLKQVYEIATQLQQSKVNKLNITRNELTEKLKTLDKISPMYSLTNDRLDINNKSLGLIKKYNDRIDELICQVELYIESIGEMCLELPELVSHKAKNDMDKTLQELNDRVAMAQRIKDEYVKEGL